MTVSAAALLESNVTPEQARAYFRERLLTAPSPTPAEVLDTPGTPESAFVHVLGEAEAARSEDRAAFAAAGYRSTAPLSWLRLHAIEFFGMAVRVAGFAATTVVLTNASGNQYGPYEPGELRFVASDTRAVYENTETVTLEPATLTPAIASVAVRAIEAGTGSNAGVGEIDRLESALEGVSVENPTPALTVDDEDAASINRRIDARVGLQGVPGAGGVSSGGPASAVESIALSGSDNGGGCRRSDGSRVEVTRTRLERDDSTGVSTLYVADNGGPILAPDLVIVGDEVTFFAERVGSEVVTANSAVVNIPVSGSLVVRKTAMTDAEIVAAIAAALPAASTAVPIGGFEIPGPPTGLVPREYIEGAIRGAGAGKWATITIALSSPVVDTALATNAIPNFQAGAFAITRIA